MSGTKQLCAALRGRIKVLRHELSELMASPVRKQARAKMKERCRTIHHQLMVLVPLSRSLHALSQQPSNVQFSAGVATYRCHILHLQELSKKLSLASCPSRLVASFSDDEFLDTEVYAPAPWAPVDTWPVVTLRTLLGDGRLAYAAQTRMAETQQGDARAARVEFLQSLTVAQQVLLKAALEAAGKVGVPELRLSGRDLK